MIDVSHVNTLNCNAARCRELAAIATDPEVAQSLLDIADEMEAAIPILADAAARCDVGDEAMPRRASA